MALNVEHLLHTADTLEQAILRLQATPEEDSVERWLAYRANRNTTAHDYGENFAEQTLAILPDYLTDLRQLTHAIQEVFNATATY